MSQWPSGKLSAEVYELFDLVLEFKLPKLNKCSHIIDDFLVQSCQMLKCLVLFDS